MKYFLLYLVVEILQLVFENIKEVIWKTSQDSQINTKSSLPEVFCQKIFLTILQNSKKNVFAGVYFLIRLQAGNLKLPEAATGDVI